MQCSLTLQLTRMWSVWCYWLCILLEHLEAPVRDRGPTGPGAGHTRNKNVGLAARSFQSASLSLCAFSCFSSYSPACQCTEPCPRVWGSPGQVNTGGASMFQLSCLHHFLQQPKGLMWSMAQTVPFSNLGAFTKTMCENNRKIVSLAAPAPTAWSSAWQRGNL